MGEAYIVRRGGFGSPGVTESGFAILCVQFPAGSTCTCTGGGERYEAEGGLAAFAVGSSGTRTVHITDGTRSKSEDAVITAAGEVKTVRIDYDPAPTGTLVILSEEDGLASGFSIAGSARIGTDGDERNHLIQLDEGDRCFYLTPALDMSAYTTLTLTAKKKYLGEGAYRIGIDRDYEKILAFQVGQAPEIACGWNDLISTGYTTQTIDISGITDSVGRYLGTMRADWGLEFKYIALS